jgi:hypothetical protein
MSSLQHIPSEIIHEFSVKADGSVTASQRGVARLAGVSDVAVLKLIKKVKESARQDLPKSLQTLSGQDFEVRGYNIYETSCLLAYFAFEAGRYKNEVAAKNLMKIPAEYHPQLSMRPTPKPGGRGAEKVVQKRLSRSLGGQMEVLTPVGKIDILTSTEIIEVKVAASWKGALGQIIAYGYFYPSHQKRIHLYGAVHSDSKEYIEKICKASGVIVTWE